MEDIDLDYEWRYGREDMMMRIERMMFEGSDVWQESGERELVEDSEGV